VLNSGFAHIPRTDSDSDVLCMVWVQPFEFVVGEQISAVGVKKISDSANGLFSGSGGPQPPPVLSTAVIGMKAGGKVRAFWSHTH
jgi:hypothetical protein